MRYARILTLLLIVTACRGAAPASKQYQVVGQITALEPVKNEITVDHKDIPGFMPAMTMPYKVKDRSLLNGLQPGDLITATLVVKEGEAWLSAITRTGHAALPPGAKATHAMDVMQPGDTVPDDVLQDQDGKSRKLSDWRGKVVAVTFVYTRCPIPNFCPLMERNFATVQQAVAGDKDLRGHVHLATISFDPQHDTPAVLKERATARNADPAVWSYLTGTPEAVAHVCERFGVSAMQDDASGQTFTHNLRTAVVDPLGRVATIYTGNEWTPEQMIDALKHALRGAKPE